MTLRFCRDEKLNNEFWVEMTDLGNYYQKEVEKIFLEADKVFQKCLENIDDEDLSMLESPDLPRQPVVPAKKKDDFLMLRAMFTDPTKLTVDGEIDITQQRPMHFSVTKDIVEQMDEWNDEMEEKLIIGLENFGLYGVPDIISHHFSSLDPDTLYPRIYKIIGARADGKNADRKYKAWCKKRGCDYYENYFQIESHLRTSYQNELMSDSTKWKVERLQKAWLFKHSTDIKGCITDDTLIEDIALDKFKKKRRSKKRSTTKRAPRKREEKVPLYDFGGYETPEEEDDEWEKYKKMEEEEQRLEKEKKKKKALERKLKNQRPEKDEMDTSPDVDVTKDAMDVDQ